MRRLLVVLLLSLACSDLTFPGERPFTPPEWYRAVWTDLSACMEVTPPPFSRLRFLMADEIDGHAGYWRPAHDLLFVHPWQDDARIVGHEMTHDLLQAATWPGHPDFRCEATILCGPGDEPCRYGGVVEH